MKKVERIKNYKNTLYVEQAQKWIEQIRMLLNIPQKEIIYTLDSYGHWNYFLCGNKVIITDINYPNGIKESSSVYLLTLLTNNPNSAEDIKFETIRENPDNKYKVNTFLALLNEPCMITEMIDLTYSEVIQFLRKYNQSTFKTDRYLFYVKPDKDYSLSYNIYAKDLKLDVELKIYVKMGLPMTTVFPKSKREIFVDDLSHSLSNYQIAQCKQAFWEFIHQNCQELQNNNFFALELIKQTIQPVEQDFGWFVNKVFDKKDTGFVNVYIDDFLTFDKKSYFFITKNDENKIRKFAVFNFLKAEYKTTGIFKNCHNKGNTWKLNKTELTQLVTFLKQQSKNKNCTNWQYLVSIYNDNTGEMHGEMLPNNIKIPDYTILAND